MRIEVDERNRQERRLPDGTLIMGGKQDYVLLTVSDADLSQELVFEVLDYTEEGEEFTVASNRPGASGPPFQAVLVSESPDTHTYRLTLAYVSLPGHKIRCIAGADRAEVVVWERGGYRIEERLDASGTAKWYVFDGEKPEANLEQARRDMYGLSYLGVIGPYASKIEAHKFLLMYLVYALSEAILHKDEGEMEKFRDLATDALFAVKL